jgi:UDP-glucose 4-epimerase
LSYDYKKLKKIIYVSTLDVYEPTDEIITEDTKVSPTTMYGLSKYYCERMIKVWGNKNKIKTQILRMGHVYGPGEEQYSKLIPSIMTSILKSRQAYINGKGENYRCYIFIEDAINAILESIHSENISEVLNIVGSFNYTVSEIVEKIIKISGYKVDIKQIKDSEKKNNLMFDNTKLIRELYSPSYNIDSGLKIEWEYLKNKFE